MVFWSLWMQTMQLFCWLCQFSKLYHIPSESTVKIFCLLNGGRFETTECTKKYFLFLVFPTIGHISNNFILLKWWMPEIIISESLTIITLTSKVSPSSRAFDKVETSHNVKYWTQFTRLLDFHTNCKIFFFNDILFSGL